MKSAKTRYWEEEVAAWMAAAMRETDLDLRAVYWQRAKEAAGKASLKGERVAER